MTQKPKNQDFGPAVGAGPDRLIAEFLTDIRRRARAVECLLNPRRPEWTFDPDDLPVDDAERLISIKREVERVFDSVFAATPRSRNAADQRSKLPHSPRHDNY